MPRRLPILALILAAFFLRGLYYCAVVPIWEGYDEWAHFDCVKHVAESGRMPGRNDAVSAEVARSLELAPVAFDTDAATIGLAHDDFWKLPEEERLRRAELLRRLPEGAAPGANAPRQYESQQPPLYYYLAAPLYLAVRGEPLPERVLWLRAANVALALLTLALTYRIARQVLGCREAALAAAALLALWPAFAVTVCRAGNESIAILLCAAVVWAAIRAAERDSRPADWLLFGAALGATLLTKAYGVVLAPLVVLAALRRGRGAWKPPLAAAAVAVAAAGWWYWRAWRETGSIAGEQLHAKAARVDAAGQMRMLFEIDWMRVLDSAAFTHIWLGGWSFLTVRSWMYRVFEVIAVAALAGILLGLYRMWRGREAGRATAVLLPAAAWVLMCAAMVYHSFVIFIAKNLSIGTGWYLYAVAAAEAALVVFGVRELFGGRGVAGLCGLAAVFDLYTVHAVLMPYYTGWIRHRAGGGLEAFQLSALPGALGEMFGRLALNDAMAPAGIRMLWVLYLAATLVLPAAAMATQSKRGPR